MLNAVGKSLISWGLPLPLPPFTKFLEWSLLRQMLMDLRANCVLDVGASRGQFAINLRRIGYKGHIVSFEPISEDFVLMESRFRLDLFWTGHNYALGNEDGLRAFQVARDSREMSSFHDTLDPNRQLRVEKVRIHKLDTVLADVVEHVPEPRRIFLKMDMQGHDVHVIQGAAQAMPFIVGLESELSIAPLYRDVPTYLEALGFYEEQGFRLVGLFEAARTNDKRLTEMNCFMVRNHPNT